MQQPVYGFVGIGRMGSLMGARLLERGHEVHVYDISADAVAALTAKGAAPPPRRAPSAMPPTSFS